MYTFLYRARKQNGDKWAADFCLYFLMFYDAEGAVEAADRDDTFWPYVKSIYPTAKRGKERRHFRGDIGKKSMESLMHYGPPHDVLHQVLRGLGDTSVVNYKKFYHNFVGMGINGFGPYTILKWADFLNTVFEIDFNMSELYRLLAEPPRRALNEVFPKLSLQDALIEVCSWIVDMEDPFSGDRYCGLSEAETVACAIPTYLIRPKYRMGDDIKKYHEQLARWPDLISLLPPKVVD